MSLTNISKNRFKGGHPKSWLKPEKLRVSLREDSPIGLYTYYILIIYRYRLYILYNYIYIYIYYTKNMCHVKNVGGHSLFGIAKELGVGMRKATFWDRSFTPGTGTAGVALHVVLDDHPIRSLAHHTSGTIIFTKELIGAWINQPCKVSGITSWLKPSFEHGSLCEGDEITSVTS